MRPCRPRTDEPLEDDRVLDLGRSTRHDSAIEVNGPDVGVDDPRARPMIAGPRTVERSSTAPSSMTTRPTTRESVEVPSSAGSTPPAPCGCPRACPRPAGVLPPARDTRCGSTSLPESTSHWIASVISSSPRATAGSRAPPRGSAPGTCRRRPAPGRSSGSGGFSTSAMTRVGAELGDAELLRVVHLGEQDLRVGLAALELVDEVGDAAR